MTFELAKAQVSVASGVSPPSNFGLIMVSRWWAGSPKERYFIKRQLWPTGSGCRALGLFGQDCPLNRRSVAPGTSRAVNIADPLHLHKGLSMANEAMLAAVPPCAA
jgi:hypothetical protein